jgi:PAS domain S-box-containing protein
VTSAEPAAAAPGIAVDPPPEVALRRSRLQLALALDAAGIAGIWEWHIAGDRLVGNAAFFALLAPGTDPAERPASLPALLERIHAEDRPQVAEAIDQARRDGTLSTEFRTLAAEEHWILAKGSVERGEDGTPERLTGIAVDVTERHAVAGALRDSEARFRAIADSMPQMVWSTRPDGHHDYYNARWYEFTGVPEGSTDGEGWNGMFHPDDQERAWAQWRHSLATGEPYEIEYRLRHHSGDYRWTLGRALPIRNERGRITRWFGTCTDIDAQKRAAEQNEILTHELSHRIKNIFAVIAGLVGLTSRRFPEARGYARDLGQRIAALGRAHDFARPHSEHSRPETGDTTLRSLLQELFRAYPAWDEGRIALDGNDVPVDDKGATPMALIFHELATNAAKYGALATAEGRVALRAAIDGGVCALHWCERGGPAVAGEPARSGFGTRLADLSVESQLGGTIRRAWLTEGLEVTIVLPLAALRRKP